MMAPPAFRVALFNARELAATVDTVMAGDDAAEQRGIDLVVRAAQLLQAQAAPCIACAGPVRRRPAYLALLTGAEGPSGGWATGLVCRRCSRSIPRTELEQRLARTALLQFAPAEGRA